MNIKVFIRSPLLILVFLCFMALGCDNPPHTIKATTSLGAEYKAPHIVVGIGTADSEHQYWPETSPVERSGYELEAASLISYMGWTSSQIKQTSPATRQYDCHGLTLDDGRTWIDNQYAEDIARHYGYKPISQCNPSTPQPGDIVIYRDSSGKVTHSGKVISVVGGNIKVHSKWGRCPDYEHDVNVVPRNYGTPSYYRRC